MPGLCYLKVMPGVALCQISAPVVVIPLYVSAIARGSLQSFPEIAGLMLASRFRRGKNLFPAEPIPSSKL